MVHDLTANGDFTSRSNTRLDFRLSSLNHETKLEDELILTGDAFERGSKKIYADYESDEKNMCDCCGSSIKIRPWDFEENKTLCPECEKCLEEAHHSREDGRLLEEVIDDSFAVRVVKPWDIRDFERENAVDNVLLWD